MKRLGAIPAIVMLFAASVMANELASSRIWTGTNGKTIRGTYIRTTKEGDKVQILGAGDKLFTIDIANLIEADQTLISGGDPEPEKDEKPTASDPSAFKDLKILDREDLPIISQGDFGRKSSDCVPSSFCNFVLWWDQEGILEIPKSGEFEDKAEWIHTRMARYCGTRNTRGTYIEDATKGFMEYFEKHAAELATYRIHTDYDLTPSNLSRYTTGEAATMLGVTIRSGPRHDSGHWVAVSTIEPTGKITFHTWGARFEGQIKILEEPKGTIEREGLEVAKTIYEIEITNTDELPDWFKESDCRFILDPENYDYLYILKPYIYSAPGKPAPAPDDPYFHQEIKPGAKVVEREGKTPLVLNPPDIQAPILPYSAATNAKPMQRVWTLKNGKKLEGSIKDYTGDGVVIITPQRKDLTIPFDLLSPASIGSALIDAGTQGSPLKSDRIRLNYQLSLDADRVVNIRIDSEGNRARIELVNYANSLTIDATDGTYQFVVEPLKGMDSRSPIKTDEVATMIGRMNIINVPASTSTQEYYEAVSKSDLKHGPQFSSRQVVARVPHNSDEVTAAVSFLDFPAAQLALTTFFGPLPKTDLSIRRRILLMAYGKSSKDAEIKRASLPFPGYFGIEAKTLPLELTWDYQDVRKRATYPVTLKLLGAEVPESFPAGHFDIPDGAKLLSAGTQELVPD